MVFACKTCVALQVEVISLVCLGSVISNQHGAISRFKYFVLPASLAGYVVCFSIYKHEMVSWLFVLNHSDIFLDI